jgi:hypothetical protein
MPDQERETAPLTFGTGTAGRTMTMFRPTEGQLLIVLQVMDLEDEEALDQKLQLVTNFGVVIRTLFTDEKDRQAVHRGLASGKYELEDYMGLARQIILEWAPEEAGNREQRRAAAKKAAPAKRAAARVRTR